MFFMTGCVIIRVPDLIRCSSNWDIMQADSTGHLNTIMTFYEIVEPAVPSPLEGLPLPILRNAIMVLVKSNRAQVIAVPDGEGVRFLSSTQAR